MRFYKASLRALIMLASTFSFLGGWVLLAHSLKPTQSNSSSFVSAGVPAVALTPLPTLPTLPGLDVQQQTQSAQQNPFTIIAQPQHSQAQTMPIFTTSGS